MKRLLLMLICLCVPILLLAGCGGTAEPLSLTPLDPASSPTLTRSERPVRITTPFGPAVTASLPSPEPTETPLPRAMPEPDGSGQAYVLNTNSKRFHLPHCSSVEEMKPGNREDFFGSRDELLARGYKPCGRCNP